LCSLYIVFFVHCALHTEIRKFVIVTVARHEILQSYHIEIFCCSVMCSILCYIR
jgi:hypothetical protein